MAELRFIAIAVAHLVSIGTGKADYATCKVKTIFSDDEIEDLAVGLQFCVQTKLGRIALARILKLSAEGDVPYDEITFSVTVWER